MSRRGLLVFVVIAACGKTQAKPPPTPEEVVLASPLRDYPMQDDSYRHVGMKLPAAAFGGIDDGGSGREHFTLHTQDSLNSLAMDLWMGLWLWEPSIDGFETRVLTEGGKTVVKREVDGRRVIHTADEAKHQVTVYVATLLEPTQGYFCKATSPSKVTAMPTPALVARLEEICSSLYLRAR